MRGRKEISVKVNLTPELFERIERFRASMFPIPSRSEVIRMILERGLEVVERERGEKGEEGERPVVQSGIRERGKEVHREKSEIGRKELKIEREKGEEGEECILGIPLRTILRCALKVEEETGSIAILDLKRVLEGEVGREIATSDVVKIISELKRRGLLKERGFVRVLSEKARKMLG